MSLLELPHAHVCLLPFSRIRSITAMSQQSGYSYYDQSMYPPPGPGYGPPGPQSGQPYYSQYSPPHEPGRPMRGGPYGEPPMMQPGGQYGMPPSPSYGSYGRPMMQGPQVP